MRKRLYRKILVYLAIISSCLCFYLYKILEREVLEETSSNNEESVIVGGMPVGIYMKTDGVLVLDTQELEARNGEVVEPAKGQVKEGDYIEEINGVEVTAKKDLMLRVSNLKGEAVNLKIRRNDETHLVQISPIEVETGEYKLGIWVRDSVQGLGTITYFTKDNQFGALGHGIHDVDTEELLDIERGNLYKVSVSGIQKSTSGSPGGIEGVIIYHKSNILGDIEINCENGIYGTVERVERLCEKQEVVEICDKKDIELGSATIMCSLGEEVREYEIEIQRVDYFTRNKNKGIIIEVVDEELIKETGGIVQGMSGSPIIQDGKLVGAVTHVLVNDPTRGYGIFIENMLDAAG